MSIFEISIKKQTRKPNLSVFRKEEQKLEKPKKTVFSIFLVQINYWEPINVITKNGRYRDHPTYKSGRYEYFSKANELAFLRVQN